MIFFIDFLRAMAMALITNSHYVGVYPTDLIANGGLLGDVIFFAVSGFCLSNIKLPFHKWYIKRIMRIYPIVWVITLVYLVWGKYTVASVPEFFTTFVFPTRYHFVGSIILLYIPYYFVAYAYKNKLQKVKDRYDLVAVLFLASAAVWLLVYWCFYDKSYYHIDTVREPMIRFLYFEAMLLGLYFKSHLNDFENKKGILKWAFTACVFAVYFVSKLLFSRRESISRFQILNQWVLLVLAAGIFMCIASISQYLNKLPAWLKSVVSYFAKITLEIYVVQQVLIAVLKYRITAFPLNWIAITASIVISATVLHYLIEGPKIIKKYISCRKEQ